jgi:glycosyltransferase involved in cell wall biosynthesis
MEAANFELSAVASNICGIPEMIKDGETGFLVDPGNLGKFAEYIIYLLNNRIAAETMGMKAKRFVVEEYQAKQVAKNITVIFNNKTKQTIHSTEH